MATKPSKIRLLERGLTFSLQNIWRNKILSIATIFVIGIIIFIFNVILTINLIAEDSLENLSKKIDVVVYLKESTELSDAQRIKTDLMGIQGVENVEYTSKNQALKDLKTLHPDLSVSFEKYDLGNPLPASLNITTSHPKYHQNVNDLLSQPDYKKYLSNIVTNNDNNSIIDSVSKNLLEVTNFTQQLVFWLVITFIVGGALIILNALQITIYNRKKEISVMKLVGASFWFIRLPFIIEGIIYGLLAVILSFLMILALSKNIEIKGLDFWNYYSSLNFLTIFLIELGVTIVLSITSSIIAVHEYLHHPRIS